jgi:phosphoglycolate phosphatase-like HAD superfamily hydrolase
VRRAGLDPDRIVGSSDVELPKPAPDMLVRASELLEVPIDSTWMIGDSRYDLEAAKSAGVFFVGLGIEGDLTLRSFGELLTAAREALAFEGS